MKGPQPPRQLEPSRTAGFGAVGQRPQHRPTDCAGARIILTVSQGLNNEQVSHAVQVGVDMVRQWQAGRWLAGQAIPLTELTAEERLRAPRAGKPAAITADQLCQITALACEKPSNRRDRSASGRAVKLPTRSCRTAASWLRFPPAMPPRLL